MAPVAFHAVKCTFKKMRSRTVVAIGAMAMINAALAAVDWRSPVK